MTRAILTFFGKIRYRFTHTRDEDINLNPNIDPTDALNVLSSDRRRHAIKYITTQNHDDAIPIGELAEFIAAQENDCHIDSVTSNQRSRVYISMIQQHCTILERANLVTYDTDRKIIEPTEQCAQVWRAYQSFCAELTG